ncbi:hypothetical protein [Halobacillus sp. Marseille-P3879]|uniref:hypothetical protein n=1 Tax=Halobacillus sp. Marseille-P3879 TaxID=2045014 RepID=UPI000C7B49F8|nr:hypothetical protein [Halobacillus sp. Marseille-P3879]
MKWFFLSILCVVVGIAGYFIYIKLHPPLTNGGYGASESMETVVISLGNKGMHDIYFTDVQINSDRTPDNAAFQVVDGATGFTLDENFENGESFGGLSQSVGRTVIRADTDPVPQNDEDIIYGLSVHSEEPIELIKVSYEYFGLRFLEEIEID